MPEPTQKPERRWFFQINMGTSDFTVLTKMRDMVQTAQFYDPEAQVHERSILVTRAEDEGGEGYVLHNPN